MLIRRVNRKFEAWRREPEAVRVRIATLLTAGTGLAGALIWLFILLPLQLRLTQPSEPDAVATELRSAVSGIRSTPSPLPTPSPTTDVKYYHETRPNLRE